jgi:hypothetical protein
MMHLTPLDWGARRFRAILGTLVTLYSAFIGGMYAQIGPSSIRTRVRQPEPLPDAGGLEPIFSDRRLGEVGHRFGGGDVGRVEVEFAHPLLCGFAGVAEGFKDLRLFRQRGAANRYLYQVEERAPGPIDTILIPPRAWGWT